jgi:intracellular sulfur oxidation DsrE/DsrF family protein
MKIVSELHRQIIIALVVMLFSACDKSTNNDVSQTVPAETPPVKELSTLIPDNSVEENKQFNLDNRRYLFDVSDHSPEDIEALLYRAEEIRETHAEGYDDLEIVLILHGPDINIFKQENYDKHKAIVDLAAKLDAFDIIDMKICEKSMSNMGIDRSEVPAFIESVPYAPDEIRRLREEGYINI